MNNDDSPKHGITTCDWIDSGQTSALQIRGRRQRMAPGPARVGPVGRPQSGAGDARSQPLQFLLLKTDDCVGRIQLSPESRAELQRCLGHEPIWNELGVEGGLERGFVQAFIVDRLQHRLFLLVVDLQAICGKQHVTAIKTIFGYSGSWTSDRSRVCLFIILSILISCWDVA